jgi:hypothetical protein
MLPFSSNEWISAWHETIGKEWELVGDNLAQQGPELILAGGYEVADYLDIPDTTKWDEIKKKFHGMHLILRNVPEDSATVKYFQMEKEDTTPITPLPPDLDKKNRHEMERKTRKFEREHTDLQFSEINNIQILFDLMKLDPRKNEFLTPDMEEFFRRIAKQFGKITVVTVSGKPAAAMLTFAVGDTLMGYNSGFDETNFSGSGFYLKAKMLERAANQGFKKFNFLQGNERYKYDLGGKDFFVYKANKLL